MNLSIQDNVENVTVNYGALSLNNQNVLNKDSLSNILATRYSSLFSTYGRNILIRHSGFLASMISAIADTTGNHHSYVFQALAMYRAIAQAATRDVNNSGSAEFTVYDGYVLSINSFSVEEDLFVNINDFKSYLNNRKLTDPDNVGIDYYLGALQNETATTLNMKQITIKLDDYFQAQYGRWPQGGQCGCCGNYVGPCLFWSKVCLYHDFHCQTCQPRWYCLPGCVPSSCNGNTMPWYWFLNPLW